MATKYLDEQGLKTYTKLIKEAIDKGGGSTSKGKGSVTEYVVGKCVRVNSMEKNCGRRVVYIHKDECVVSVKVSKADNFGALIVRVKDQKGNYLPLSTGGRTAGKSVKNITRNVTSGSLTTMSVSSNRADGLVYGNIPVVIEIGDVQGVRVTDVVKTSSSITVTVELTKVPGTVAEIRSPYRKWVNGVYRSMRRPDMGDNISYNNDDPRPLKKTRAWRRQKVNTKKLSDGQRNHFRRTTKAGSGTFGLLFVQAIHKNEKPGCIVEQWMVAKKAKGYIRKKVG